MEAKSIETYVHSERHVIKGRYYDLAVYRTGDVFYAAWSCLECCGRNETARYRSQIITYQAAEDAMLGHAEAVH